MGYLILSDYDRLIQKINTQQLISGNESLRSQAELAALTEIKSYLVQKYDVASEFTNTNLYNPNAVYKAANRVYLDASLYDESKTYALKDLTCKSGKIYQCSTAIVAPEEFTIGKWSLLGNQYDIFYANYPYPIFDLLKLYDKATLVFWKDHTYTCLIATPEIDHETIIQFPTTNSIPYTNVFPDDPKNGSKYWHDEGSYTIPAGNLLTSSPAYFTLGDNRNQQLLNYVLDVTIYNLYRRIPPGVVPDIRITAYQVVKNWLNNVAKGNEITADIAKLQPPSGSRVRFGSRTKNENYY